MKKRLTTFCFVFILSMVGNAQTQHVVVPNSETKRINSKIVAGQEYELQIMLPAGYEKSNKNYSVVYLMDSQWDFPLVTALYGQQYYDGFIPELIVVGITWTGKYSNPDSLRARDYTPTTIKQTPQSGGANAFLSCLKNEIFPFVEANYKADKNDRTLMGCSLGGLFTLYALFTQPGLFQRYVAASPAIAWDNGVLNQYAKAYFMKKEVAPAKLFLCVGGVERSASSFEDVVRTMNGVKPSSLQVQSRVLENTGHSGTKGEGYTRGLQFVFQKPKLKLGAAALNKYVGTYQIDNAGTVDIKADNDGLILFVSPTNKYTLYAASDKDFYANSEFLNLHFTADGFQLERYDNSSFAKKLNQENKRK